MKMLLISNKMFPGYDHLIGWGNGYVGVEPTSPLFGLDYSKIYEYIDIHGGLTFSGYVNPSRCKDPTLWYFGFDTAHHGDCLINCDFNFVKAETEKLLAQLQQLEQLYPLL